ncbi:hypothetical protein BJ508DRAFT_33815 [Ascobolus immersus RN42]|uniref:Uncharacterized protein n=1 Tax=Ascobolus immersus RN42 TaxID=1160509 RepID=A0A3N4HNR8_ASCIM|nr:hypothetical protein BJ508DRAFT_33815 [Ascobolus immersus RN42]
MTGLLRQLDSCHQSHLRARRRNLQPHHHHHHHQLAKEREAGKQREISHTGRLHPHCHHHHTLQSWKNGTNEMFEVQRIASRGHNEAPCGCNRIALLRSFSSITSFSSPERQQHTLRDRLQ